MAEVPVTSLDPRHRKLIENARTALERGNFDYVCEATAQILKTAPGCLPVRKLQRMALLRRHGGKNNGLLAKVSRGLSGAPFVFNAARQDPAKLLAVADDLLAKDPHNIAALKMLADAAQARGWLETAAFALDAIREIEPENGANLLALGEAWLAAGKPGEALSIADEILRQKPADSAAQDLMRKASIAQTITKHNWDSPTSYREKLRDEAQAISLPHSASIGATHPGAAPRLEEALARVAKEPDNLTHYRTVARNYRQLGNIAEALSWIRRGRQRPGGREDAALEKEASELETAQLKQRLAEIEARVQAAPHDPTLRLQVEGARRELAEFEVGEAKRHLERYPNDHAARHAFGIVLLELGQLDAAIGQLQQAQKAPQVRVASLVSLGRCFKAKRLYDLAIAQFKTAKAELPVASELKKDVIYDLASCYELLGQTDAALAEFKLIYSEDIGFRDVADKINAHYST